MNACKFVALGQILTKDQLQAITKILNSRPAVDRFKKLRQYLITQRESLELQGVLPEYLAYAIEYHATQ